VPVAPDGNLERDLELGARADVDPDDVDVEVERRLAAERPQALDSCTGEFLALLERANGP
jgi:hypothetical protein